MKKLILIKYGELTTKKGNRNVFIKRLSDNIENVLKGTSITIKKDRVRMYIDAEEKDFDVVVSKLKKVFGIFAFVIAHKVETDEDLIKEEAIKFIKDTDKTFKIVTKRADKNYPTPSMEFNRIVASYILKNKEIGVDVHNPDVLIRIEIRIDGTYIYTDEVKGSGGYPVGVQGKGLLMLSGGIDSPVAGYLAMKRGVDLECLYFDSPPHTSIEAKNKVIKLADIINDYSGNLKVHVVHFTEIQETIYKTADQNYIITMMRRMMYRIGEEVARRRKLKIMINGESIGQVASQTLDSIAVINSVTAMPVIRPVATMDKIEIINLSEKIGTYKTSILPFEDCCTIFLPKHPVINPKLGKCLAFEELVDYDELIKKAVDNLETITDLKQKDYSELL